MSSSAQAANAKLIHRISPATRTQIDREAGSAAASAASGDSGLGQRSVADNSYQLPAPRGLKQRWLAPVAPNAADAAALPAAQSNIERVAGLDLWQADVIAAGDFSRHRFFGLKAGLRTSILSRRYGGRAGMTLFETLVALTMFGAVGMAVVSFFLIGIQTSAGVARQNLMSVYGRTPVEQLKDRVRSAAGVAITDGGDRLTLTHQDGSKSAYWLDTTAPGPRAGRLMFRPDEKAEAEPVLRDVGRAASTQPVFRSIVDPTRSEIVAVGVHLRLGDPIGPLAEAGSAGRHRAVDVATTVCLRNLSIDGES